MPQIHRSAGAQVNRLVVGPMVMLIGVGAAITGVVLAVVLEVPLFLLFVALGAAVVTAGFLVQRMGRRARLEFTADGFTWCGFLGSERSLRWEQVHRILPPPPGAPRVAALAQLRDGSVQEVRAVWESGTSPSVLAGGSDHAPARAALITAHQAWLAGRR